MLTTTSEPIIKTEEKVVPEESEVSTDDFSESTSKSALTKTTMASKTTESIDISSTIPRPIHANEENANLNDEAPTTVEPILASGGEEVGSKMTTITAANYETHADFTNQDQVSFNPGRLPAYVWIIITFAICLILICIFGSIWYYKSSHKNRIEHLELKQMKDTEQ